jgi:hypothetical protein
VVTLFCFHYELSGNTSLFASTDVKDCISTTLRILFGCDITMKALATRFVAGLEGVCVSKGLGVRV